VVNSPVTQTSRVNVTTGNFVTASPAGIYMGSHLQHTGEVSVATAVAVDKEGEIFKAKPDVKTATALCPLGA
jgi:hypothetical protein